MLKAIIKSMRLRTLPLSLSGIIVGMAAASLLLSRESENQGIRELGKQGTMESGNQIIPEFLNPSIPQFPQPSTLNLSFVVFFLVLTTICLQVVSNMSNELGDTLHATDSDDRQGIHYSLQDGDMTIGQLKRLIGVFVVLSCVFGALMIFFSFGTLFSAEAITFLLLGVAAIWAAMHYTLGNNPYGYRGLGDISVFVFFGLATTFGGYYLCSHDFSNIFIWLLASAIGCFSVAVLNVNNIRDIKSDARTRTTVAIKLGEYRARMYQTFLISLGWLLMIAYTTATFTSWKCWIYVVTLPLFIIHMKGVWTRTDHGLDPMLPLLVISTFVMSMLFAIGLLL